VWEAVRGLVADGTTVLLTTQLLDEADQLVSAVTVVDHGRGITEGTPHQLKARMGGDRIDVVVRRAEQLLSAAAVAARVASGEPAVHEDSRLVSAPVGDRVAALTAVVRAPDEQGIEVEDVAVRRPTLDEVFLEVTA
jgi:ABC-2 type transport system ATP-binding protein